MIRRLVIFGASGDLTWRYLLPAVARLQTAGMLPEGFSITAVARDEQDTEGYRRRASEQLAHHAGEISMGVRDAVLAMLAYRRADVTDAQAVAAALHPITEPLAAYLALPPTVFAPVITALADVGLPEGSRIVVEKPFGEDLDSARRLNRLLHQSFPEDAVVRVDHFLAEQTVQNILGLRFANRVFEPLWSREHIHRVEIIWDETLALEGRASYYDGAGALRDVVQNHLLQLLALVGMEPPLSLTGPDLRDRKVDLLRAVRPLTPEEVRHTTVRARYSAGRRRGRALPAYVDEAGVDPTRDTETYARVTLTIDTARWSGVPFILRTGRALAADRHEIAIHFEPVLHHLFSEKTEPHPNVLRLTFNPDALALGININGPGDFLTLDRVDLGCALAQHELSAYGNVLLDVLTGNSRLSIRDDEAEESWRIVEPILSSWGAGQPALLEYPAGSQGPE